MTALIAAAVVSFVILFWFIMNRKSKSRLSSTLPIQFVSGNNPFEKFVMTNRERAHRVGFLS